MKNQTQNLFAVNPSPIQTSYSQWRLHNPLANLHIFRLWAKSHDFSLIILTPKLKVKS